MPRILILTDTYTADDEAANFPFTGAGGFTLDKILSQIGILRSECDLAAVFPFYPQYGKTDDLFTRDIDLAASNCPIYLQRPLTYLHKDYKKHYTALLTLIEKLNPPLILCLGSLALWAVTGKLGIDKNRGAPMLSRDQQTKVIATYSMSAVMKNWSLRPIVVQDFNKAKEQAKTRALIRPRRYLHLNPTLADLAEFYEQYIEPAPVLSIDIETKAGQITEVGIATSRNRALVIPFWLSGRGNYWPNVWQEAEAWSMIRKTMLKKHYIGQNFQYDMQYFYRVMGIPCPGFIGDTMLLHHSMQPEMEKGLGFLGSIYTNEPAWKFMRLQAETLKKEV